VSPAHLTDRVQELAERLREDINLCKTREEHIRVSARANAAAHVLQDLLQFLDERASLSSPDTTPDIGAGPED
jgi:molecular chaperone GrpE (heat shock protein)